MPERPVVKRFYKGLCTQCGRKREPDMELRCKDCIRRCRRRMQQRSMLPGAPWLVTDKLGDVALPEYAEYFE